MRRGNALKTAVADVPLAGETVPQLPWPEDIPSYYLEEQAPNLFRRVELADRPGYVVTLRRTAGAPDKVEVLLVQQSFVPTGYNETMQSYIGRPMLLKTVRTATAPLKPGMATVLLWTELRPASGSREAAERLRGTWTFVVEGNEREGSVSQAGLAWPIPYAQAPNELLQVPLDGQGGVAGEFTAPDGRRWRVTGKLNDDGTGAGTLAPQDGGPAVPWSANRRPAATGGTGGRGGSGGFGGGGFGG
ncbi:MAG: hypothetical protein FJ313_03730, partial [Gemmatimonadetes bacterium]|nr:hypothetical protein [Gemmatimonadota bacterium]